LSSYLKVIGTRRQELITNVQRLGRIDIAKVSLAGSNTPGFIADIDKDVISAWEMKVSDAFSIRVNGYLERYLPLNAQNGSREPTADLSTVF
jgi:hypothetical protein